MGYRRFLQASLRRQWPLLRRTLWAAYLPLVLLHAGLALQDRVPVGALLRDPNAVMGLSFYYGALSHLGVLLWWAAAVVGVFSAFVLRAVFRLKGAEAAPKLLLWMGVLTALLALDDLFMLHEEALPLYLGIPEWSVFAFHGLFAAGILLAFRRVVLRSDFLLLGLALGFFALSILVDLGMLRFLFGIPLELDLLLEDAAKLLGIASWLSYLGRTAFVQLKGGLEQARDVAPVEAPVEAAVAATPRAPGATAPYRQTP